MNSVIILLLLLNDIDVLNKDFYSVKMKCEHLEVTLSITLKQTNKKLDQCVLFSFLSSPSSLDVTHITIYLSMRTQSLIIEMFKVNPLQTGGCWSWDQFNHETTVSPTMRQLLSSLYILESEKKIILKILIIMVIYYNI